MRRAAPIYDRTRADAAFRLMLHHVRECNIRDSSVDHIISRDEARKYAGEKLREGRDWIEIYSLI